LYQTIITLNDLTVEEAAILYGVNDENLQYLENHFNVSITARNQDCSIQAESKSTLNQIKEIFDEALKIIRIKKELTIPMLEYMIEINQQHRRSLSDLNKHPIASNYVGKTIYPKTFGQLQFFEAMKSHDLTFSIGPAGTGKTYLAVVYAVWNLRHNHVKKIILTRPAVEAGENLGFLPGDLKEKVDPYLRPLYDALYDMLGVEATNKYLEKGAIEIAPLAYMRGRTLDQAFVILDEAQNTLPSQMKMFLTRMGNDSKVVVTGDITQIDLRKDQPSGLKDAISKLANINEISFIYLDESDVVRHPLVKKILKRYEAV
jgi:phosphate starvation-inducible protein PhoH and related proteins